MEANEVVSIKKFLISSLLEKKKVLHVSQEDLYDFSEIIGDRTLLYRFIIKHNHDLQSTSIALIHHLDWRIENRIASLSINSMELHSKLIDDGIFILGNVDNRGRPLAFIKPGLFKPGSAKEVEELKSAIIMLLEIIRRLIFSIDIERKSQSDIITQAAVVVDLRNFGIGNMDFEIVPIIYDIFKRQYPQILGQAFVLNYGWVHAGIWSVLKTMMTAEAKEKLKFIQVEELPNYIPIENIPIEWSGKNERAAKPRNCPLVRKYGQPLSSQSIHDSLKHVYDSLCNGNGSDGSQTSSDVFFDAKSHFSRDSNGNFLRRAKTFKSAADLQSFLPSHHSKGGSNSLSKTLSTGSLGQLRSRSHMYLSRINSKDQLSFTVKSTSSNPKPNHHPVRGILTFFSNYAPQLFFRRRRKRKLLFLLFSSLCIIYLRFGFRLKALLHQ